jgi:hypothetical protein
MNKATARTLLGGALLLIALTATPARAQEAIHTDSTAVPSVGQIALRESVRYLQLGDDPTPADRDVEEWRSITTMEYGFRPDLTFAAYVPLVYREIDYGSAAGSHGGSHSGAGSVSDFGLDDITLSAKWRVYRNDFGPIDTARFAVIFGAELPTGEDAFSSDSVDPIVGGVFSYIQDRHGFNAELRYQFTTGGMEDAVLPAEGSADALFYNAAYLFRVWPAEFSAGSRGALYAVLESNGVYETNSDDELLIAPGVLFEASHFALEASIQLPLWQDLEDRPETDFTVTIGARFLF